MGDWKVGDRVAVLSGAPYGGDQVSLASVERITATQVVLEGGQRFRRDDGTEVRQRGAYERRSELRDPDDPQVRHLRAEQAVTALVRRITNAQKDTRDPLALLDLIEAETDRTRAAVEKLTKED